MQRWASKATEQGASASNSNANEDIEGSLDKESDSSIIIDTSIVSGGSSENIGGASAYESDQSHQEPVIEENNDNDVNCVYYPGHSSDSDSNDSDFDPTEIVDQLLYDGTDMTVCHAVSSLMDLYVEQKLTKVTLERISNLLHRVLPTPNNMPKTLYQLFKFVEEKAFKPKVIKHYYCKKCILYNETCSILRICPSCGSTEGTAAFYELDIIEQIKNLFEHRNLASKLQPFAPRDENLISDIKDGSEYIRINSYGRQEYDNINSEYRWSRTSEKRKK